MDKRDDLHERCAALEESIRTHRAKQRELELALETAQVDVSAASNVLDILEIPREGEDGSTLTLLGRMRRVQGELTSFRNWPKPAGS